MIKRYLFIITLTRHDGSNKYKINADNRTEAMAIWEDLPYIKTIAMEDIISISIKHKDFKVYQDAIARKEAK